jgi:hypothetical protein
MPSPAELQAAIAAVSAGNQTAEQAAMVNAAYNQNALPITPAVAQPSGYTQAQQQDAAYEAEKHMRLFHPQEYYGFQYADVANMPLGQIAARYGEGAADATQSYYQQNPSAKAQAIVKQYEEQQNFVNVGYSGLGYQQGTIVPNVLAGEGGFTGRAKEYKDQWQPLKGDLYAGIAFDKSGAPIPYTETTPVRDLTSGMLSGSRMVAALEGGRTVDIYSPWGEYTQVKTENAKGLLGYNTGELGIYVKPYGHSTYMLTGGGGRNALQSGMFSVDKALTPYVVDRGDVGSYVLPSGTGMSRLGAEAYGGFVRPLDDRTLAPNDAISRYFGEGANNLANFVAQVAGGKAEAPGAKIPWSVGANAPALQYMDKSGVIAGSAIEIPGAGRIVGSKTVASVGGTSDIVYSEATVKQPFVSARYNAAPASQIVQPTGEIEIPFTGFKFKAPIVSDVMAFFQPQQKVEFTKSGETVLPSETKLVGETVTPISGGNITTKYYETTGGKQTDYSGVATPVPGSSGYDKFNQGIRDFLKLPSAESGERALSVAAWANPMTLPFKIEEQITGKPSYGASVLGVEGQYRQFYEQPAAFALNLGIGAAIGGVAKGVEAAYIGTKAMTAERVISQGGVYRAAEQVGGSVMGRAPQVLGALYAADIGMRSTDGLSNFSPVSVTQRAKGIIAQEAVPMGIGLGLPGAAVKAAKVSDIGYQSAVQEGTATGRFDYYVKQPVGSAYEVAATPVARARLEFPQFVEEAGGSTVKGAVKYGMYKTGMEQPVSPELIRPTIPQESEFATGSVYARDQTVSGRVKALFDRPYQSEATRNYYDYEGIVKDAYPQRVGRDIPRPKDVAQDVLASAYSKYYDLRAGAARTPAPEVVRPNVAPENEYAFRYDNMPALTRISSLSPSRIIPLSTFGEVAPLGGVVSVTKGGSGGTGPTTPSGGSPPGQALKFRKTSLGTGVAKEPSLASMGFKEAPAAKGSAAKASSRTGSAIDYRGKPASATMKPMTRESLGYRGKQAAGQQAILTEQLPMVEGMTQGKVAPQQYRFAGAPSLVRSGIQQGVIQVVEPELTFAQESQIRQAQILTPASAIRSAGVTVQPQTEAQAIVQRSQQVQFVGTAGRMASETRMAISPSFRLDTTPSSTVKSERIIVPDISIRQSSGTDQRIRQDQRTSQITDSGSWMRGWETPWEDIKTPPGGGGWPGGAGGATPASRKRRAAFTETFNMGLDMGFFGRKGRASKSYTTPAKYRRKPKVAARSKSKGGKKK